MFEMHLIISVTDGAAGVRTAPPWQAKWAQPLQM